MKKSLETYNVVHPYCKKTLRVMKCIILLVGLTLSQVFAGVKAQEALVDLNVKNSTFKEVVDILRTQTDYSFIFNTADIESVDNLNIKAEKKPLKDVMNSLLAGTNLSYKYIDNTIVIMKDVNKKAQQAEKVSIKGTVKDSRGHSMPGVSVFVKGTQAGVATDIDGKYELRINDKKGAVLVFSFVGMQTQEIVYKGQKTINVVLKDDAEQLEEVVITGYQVISKERATGSFKNIEAKSLDEKIGNDLFSKMEGQVSGMLLQKNSDGKDEYMIRGKNSIYSENKPLIVVDGFPIEGDMSTVNPENIEKISVLKDASATSIYGARAANGVIVITTKNAKKDGLTVDYSFSLRFQQSPDLYSLPIADTRTMLELEKYIGLNYDYELPTEKKKTCYSEGVEMGIKQRLGLLTESQVNKRINELSAIDSRRELEDLFLRDAVSNQHFVTINKKNDKTSYSLALKYANNKEYIKGNDAEDFQADLKMITNLNDKLRFQFASSFSKVNRQTNGISLYDQLSTPQYQRILDENGDYITQRREFDQGVKENWVAKGLYYDWNYNLKREYDNKNNKKETFYNKLIGKLTYDIIDGLDFESSFQYEKLYDESTVLQNEEMYYTRKMVNTFTQITDNSVIYGLPRGSILNNSFSSMDSYTWREQLNFNRNFGTDHSLNGIAGIEVRKSVNDKNLNNIKYGYDSQSLISQNVDYVNDIKTVFGNKTKIANPQSKVYIEDRFVSYYGNLGYSYLGKYHLTASARLDDSNLFGASKKYRNVPLWSVGGKWDLFKEDYFDSESIDMLALRFTYGTGGNINKDTSPYLIAQTGYDPWTSTQFAYVKNPANPYLRWEKVNTYNFAVDFAMFKNRISGTLDTYYKKSVDLLGDAYRNPTLGFNKAFENIGELSNKGFDLNISALVVDREIQWNSTLNLSYNKNEITKVELPQDTPGSYLPLSTLDIKAPKKGLPIDYIYSYRWAGLSADKGYPQIYNAKGEKITPDKEILDKDALKYEGSLTPKFYGSFINTVSYKNFDLSVFAIFKLGHKFRKDVVDYTISQNYQLGFVDERLADRWRQPKDEQKTDIPAMPEKIGDWNFKYNKFYSNADINVLDASHIRLKDITLTYNVNSNLVKKVALSNLKLSFNVRNIACIAFNEDNIDPENQKTVTGGGFGYLPEFTFGLKANF